MAIGLTSRQATVFDAIKALSEGAGIMPTFEELMAATGITSKSAMHDTLCAIEGRGLIRRQKGRARAIEIVEDANSRAELARQLAAAKQTIATLIADNEALQRTVAKMCAAFNEITDPDTIWCAIDGVHDFDASLNDYAAAVSKAQRAEWEASK